LAALWESRFTRVGTCCKKPPKHHVVEYRISYAAQTEEKPAWIHSNSGIARVARGIGWIVFAVITFFGANALFVTAGLWFGLFEVPHGKLVALMLGPTGLLALIAGYWIGKSIEVPCPPDDDEEDD